jgi:signal transduction histidine kinase
VEIPDTGLNYFDNHYGIVEIMVGVKRRLTLILLGTVVSLSSIAQIDSLEAVVKATDSDSIRVRAYLALSSAYQFQNYAKAKSNSAHAMDIAEREDWDWALYESYKQEALLCSLAGDFTSALKFDNENLSVALEQHDSTALTEIFNFIGNDFNELGRYDEAYYYFVQSNQVAKAIGDSMYMNVSMHNIGSVFKELGQYDIALSHFKAARNIGQKIGDHDGLAYYHDERADVFLRSKRYDSAAKALREARKVIGERKLGVIEHRTLTKLARLNFEQGDLERALDYYDSTLALHKKSDNMFGMAETNLGIAEVFVAQKKWKEAEALSKEALETGRKLNAHQLVFKSYQLLSELAEKNGDFKDALTYYKNYRAFQDSVFSNDMIQELFERQLRFVTEDKDSEIALLSREKEEQRSAHRRQEFLTNILAVVVALAAIVLVTVYRSGRRRIRINKLLLEHQAEIKKRSVELEQLNQVKDKFFSIISHDLRSPMNALAGLLDLSEKKHLSQNEFVQLTNELRQQFNHTKTLINNLLDWTLLQMDKLKIQQDRVDLKTMVDENIRLFDSMQLKTTIIHNNIPSGTVASADTNMVNLVFRNLILNAIKFTESGGVVDINSSVQNDGFILVSVADNGVGIEPEVQRILFEKTSGYSTRGTANEKGTGLGLILCKEFVEKNGGKIWLESKPGTGSTFYFTLKKA